MHRPISSTGLRVPSRQSAQAAQDLRQALADLEVRIECRREILFELYNRAKLPDRVMAVHRMLREAKLSAADAEAVTTLDERVQRAWAALRAARTGGEKARVLQLEVEVQLAERDRDAYIVEHGLTDALFRYGESFLIDVPYDRDLRPLGEMLERKQRILDQLERLEARREATVQRRIAIRVLSPLSMSSEAIPVVNA